MKPLDHRIYFDAQATTPLLPEILEAMLPFLEKCHGRSDAAYLSAKKARKAKWEAREKIAAMIGADSPEEIYFTQSDLQANHLAIMGYTLAMEGVQGDWLSSACDAPSVRLCDSMTQRWSCRRREFPVNVHGLAMLDPLLEQMQSHPLMVSLPLTVPEWGSVQSLEAIASACDSKGVALFVDATHGGGWHTIDVSRIPVSMLSLAPHRFHGPAGVGLLYRRKGTPMGSLLPGERSEAALSPGMESMAAIVGAGEASARSPQGDPQVMNTVRRIRHVLTEGLEHHLDGVAILQREDACSDLSHYLSVAIDGVDGEALMLMANVRGLECHSGVSCRVSQGEADRLTRVCGLPEGFLRSCITLSWHAMSHEEEAHKALEILLGCVKTLREMSPSWSRIASGENFSMSRCYAQLCKDLREGRGDHDA